MAAPILVTSAAGFVGSHLLDHLTQTPTPIVAWQRPDVGTTSARPNVTWMAIELHDQQAVTRAIADVSPGAVYHLAGAAHVAESWHNTLETYHGNVLATHHLFEGMRANKLSPRIVVSGSATIYRPQDRPIREDDVLGPASPYATSKLVQEMLARRAWEDDGLPTVIARSFNHVGPRQDPSYVAPAVARQIALIEAGRQEPVLMTGNLGPTRDVMDGRDTVRAYAARMESGKTGQPYNVCSGRGLTIGDLVGIFTSRARTPITIAQDPARFRANDIPLLVGDHARLTLDTGWTPQIAFEQTVDDLLEYWRRRVR